jgi:hypothetical protein
MTIKKLRKHYLLDGLIHKMFKGCLVITLKRGGGIDWLGFLTERSYTHLQMF